MRPTAVPLLLLVVVPAVHSFFWGCNVVPHDLPDIATIKEKLAELFPAKIYLREAGNAEEQRYSCITITSHGPVRRGADAGMSPFMRADDVQNFSGTISFYELEALDSKDVYYSIDLGGAYSEMNFEDLPITMFQEDTEQNTASLLLTYLGNNYAIFDACVNFFLSFGNLRSSYMLVSPDFVVSPLDWRCVADALTDITGVPSYHPVGICD